jgi:hypothetical protein
MINPTPGSSLTDRVKVLEENCPGPDDVVAGSPADIAKQIGDLQAAVADLQKKVGDDSINTPNAA